MTNVLPLRSHFPSLATVTSSSALSSPISTHFTHFPDAKSREALNQIVTLHSSFKNPVIESPLANIDRSYTSPDATHSDSKSNVRSPVLTVSNPMRISGSPSHDDPTSILSSTYVINKSERISGRISEVKLTEGNGPV